MDHQSPVCSLLLKAVKIQTCLHVFPNDSKVFYDWCGRIGLIALKMENCKNFLICDCHFDEIIKIRKRYHWTHLIKSTEAYPTLCFVERNSTTTSAVVIAGGKRPQHNISCGSSSLSADLLLQSPVHKKRREDEIPSCASGRFISDKTLGNHSSGEDPLIVIDKIEIDEEDILDKHESEIKSKTAEESGGFTRANVTINSEESDKTLKNHLGEDPFIVIDKIEIDEEDILDKHKSEIKSKTVEESGGFTRANVTINSEESDKTLKNHLGEDPFIVIDKNEIDEENILDKHKSEIKSKTAEESGGFTSANVVVNCEESDKTLKNRLEEDPFIVIDKIETYEEDILDKIQSNIKSEKVEEAVNVLKDSRGLIVNDHLETIVYEDYDACSSPKHSESLITFNNKTTTNSTLSITEESQDIDVLHLNKVAELARKIKMIEQSFEIKGKREDTKLPLTSERKLYKCDVCEKTFRKSDIIVHKYTHTGEKPLFECNICGNKFFQLSKCRNHVLEHTGEKLYECNICRMKFTRLWKRINHERKHIGEKQLEHTHTGEKPFKCNTCELKKN